eukprot:CAMPEP_0184120746 /NCGR_PEP_ID=MMETSP0974-20121125/22620_1 /TAXON_ID=483370 /ORGANISM="non described non described, Strain CCMP2097" /LENGTH=81 /DNA_ID=CAMNT_0026423941 /DNA_START=147 /DNA_END=389 /DNA_ORIENTATION=-
MTFGRLRPTTRAQATVGATVRGPPRDMAEGPQSRGEQQGGRPRNIRGAVQATVLRVSPGLSPGPPKHLSNGIVQRTAKGTV